MMIIDGKKIGLDIQEEIRQTLTFYPPSLRPCLSVILIGRHPSSQLYIERKTKACEAVGIDSIKIEKPASISESELLLEIEKLNQDPNVHGILVQLPLPSSMNQTLILSSIHPDKDVDGFHPLNVGKTLVGDPTGFIPCTPLGIQVLLERYRIQVAGQHALIIGRSNIVGKPMASLLMQNGPGGNATVTVANRHSKNLKQLCLSANILIVAIGQPKLITADMVKEGSVVIDVGINQIEDHRSQKKGYRLVGDVDFDQVRQKCSYITPVPGGVGPMTIAMLLSNTLKSFERKFKNDRSNP